MEWISVEKQTPPHMKEIRVWIEDPYFGSYERPANAIFLAFDGNFYDSQEQTSLKYIKKWKLAPLKENALTCET
jgi:hypothetical protein